MVANISHAEAFWSEHSLQPHLRLIRKIKQAQCIVPAFSNELKFFKAAGVRW